jgi:hypothetical protein
VLSLCNPPCSLVTLVDYNLYTGFDPRTYTSGRWLRRDKLERDSRYISFNFDALCRRVVELCPGAVSITTYEKKEGGFNRVFFFTTDNAKRVVARLPFTLAGPPRLTTSSEVATIKYREFKSIRPMESTAQPANRYARLSTNQYQHSYTQNPRLER